ncbi:MAG: magnesium transporter [Promethearchaeia archaeon]
MARLTTNLFLGVIPPELATSKKLKDEFINFFIVLTLCIITVLIIGFLLGTFTGVPLVDPFLIIFLVFISVIVIFFGLFFFLFIAGVILYRRGYNPNNFLIPSATTLADFVTPIFLITLLTIFI